MAQYREKSKGARAALTLPTTSSAMRTPTAHRPPIYGPLRGGDEIPDGTFH